MIKTIYFSMTLLLENPEKLCLRLRLRRSILVEQNGNL